METVDARLKSPFTATVAGPTGSGKTRLLMRLIDSARTVTTVPPEEIIYCYGAWQEAYNDVKGVRFHEGVIDVVRDIPNDGATRWLIMDDLMEEADKKQANNLFTKHSHHRKICVFFVTQNAFDKDNRTRSLNSQYFFFLKNPRNLQMAVIFATQAFPGRVAAFREALRKATERPWSNLMVDMRRWKRCA